VYRASQSRLVIIKKLTRSPRTCLVPRRTSGDASTRGATGFRPMHPERPLSTPPRNGRAAEQLGLGPSSFAITEDTFDLEGAQRQRWERGPGLGRKQQLRQRRNRSTQLEAPLAAAAAAAAAADAAAEAAAAAAAELRVPAAADKGAREEAEIKQHRQLHTGAAAHAAAHDQSRIPPSRHAQAPRRPPPRVWFLQSDSTSLVAPRAGT
jgi:hypothetical protein